MRGPLSRTHRHESPCIRRQSPVLTGGDHRSRTGRPNPRSNFVHRPPQGAGKSTRRAPGSYLSRSSCSSPVMPAIGPISQRPRARWTVGTAPRRAAPSAAPVLSLGLVGPGVGADQPVPGCGSDHREDRFSRRPLPGGPLRASRDLPRRQRRLQVSTIRALPRPIEAVDFDADDAYPGVAAAP